VTPRLSLVLAAVLAAGAAGCRGIGAPQRSEVLEECPPGEGPSDALCGSIEVFEDRQAASGRRIPLRVVVLPALSREPRPDPLLILAGGPGQAATQLREALGALVRQVQAERDVIFVDQRGTGKSGALDCEVGEELEGAPDAVAAALETLKGCLEGYEADTRHYTTPNAVDDFDEVRERLGYEQLNLWGGSYGTRVALVYLRRHPERVRSAVIDGVAPVNMRLPITFARDGERALRMLFEACAADAGCAEAFPEVEPRTRALLEELERAPRHVTLKDPVSGESEELDIAAETVSGIVRLALYNSQVSALLPLLLSRAAEGDFAGLAAIASAGGDGGISPGLMLSVLCTEDVAWIEREQALREAQGSFLGIKPVERLTEACSLWPRGELPEGYAEPVRSERPVLALSGELDPVTPPSWAEAAVEHLPNARHVVAKGIAHGTSMLGCLPERIAEFLEAGDARDLDFSCVEELGRPPFFLGPAGPVPPPAHEEKTSPAKETP
jgi:pimeloyl-ACP methyl ester carboxylesterase